jgi:hypothetical protein
MRIQPTSIDFSNVALNDFNGVYVTVSTLTLGRTSANTGVLTATAASALMTANRVYVLTTQNTTANGYVGFNSEL